MSNEIKRSVEFEMRTPSYEYSWPEESNVDDECSGNISHS